LCLSNKIDVALIITILIFLAGIILNSQRDRKLHKAMLEEEAQKQIAIRKRYLVAMKEEIELNIGSLTKILSYWPQRPLICQFLGERKKNRPVVTFSHSSAIFKNRLEVLQDLPDVLINNIVDFYGKLDALTADVAAIEAKGFETISNDGREGIILDIIEEQKILKQQGTSLLTAIKLRLLE
jgi:hypothetical protein